MKTYVVTPQFLVTKELIELASAAIDSFKNNSDVTFISVDDGGEHGLKEGSEMLKEKSDIYLKNEKNSGFGVTCNNGFKWIFENEKNDCYIICANNDILIHDRVIPELKRPFDILDNVAITGIFSFTSLTPENRPIEQFRFNKMAEGQLGDRMQDGGLWMSKKSILEKIGIFDEQFLRGGYEDVDLFLRARDVHGMRIIMSGLAGYWHKQGATRWNSEQVGAVNNFGLESKQIENENLKKFINKWGFNPHFKDIWKSKEVWSE